MRKIAREYRHVTTTLPIPPRHYRLMKILFSRPSECLFTPLPSIHHATPIMSIEVTNRGANLAARRDPQQLRRSAR